MSETQENSTPPTEHALRRAREQGKIAYSHHLAVAVTSIGILGLTAIFGKSLLNAAIDDLTSSLSRVETSIDFSVNNLWDRPLFRPIALFIGSICLITVLSRIIQVGILLQPSRAMPQIANIDFAKGVQRIFSMSNLMRCFQILLASIGFMLLLVVFFSQNYESLVALGIAEVELLPSIVSAEFGKLLAIASMISLAVGVIDYFYQRTKLMSELQKDENASRRPVQAIFNERQAANRRG